MSLKKFLLTWDAAGGEPTGYKAEYKKTADSSWTEYPQVFPTTSGFVTGLDVCNFYDFRVFGVNIRGNGLASSPATGIMGRIPGSPVGLVATSRYVSDSDSVAIDLSWSTDNGGCEIQQTFIEHKISDSPSNYITNTLLDNTTNYSITGLAGNTAYDIRLRARNVVGTGNYSDEFFHTTVNAPTTNLNVEYIENSPAVLTIQTNTDSQQSSYILVSTDTGHYKVEDWDDDVVKISNTPTYKTVSQQKTISIYACDEQGNKQGNITSLKISDFRITNIDVSNLKELTTLAISDYRSETNEKAAVIDINIDISHLLKMNTLTLDIAKYNILSLRAAGVALATTIIGVPILQPVATRFYQDLKAEYGSITIPNYAALDNTIATEKGYYVSNI